MAIITVNNALSVPVVDDHDEVIRQLGMAIDNQTMAVFRRTDGRGSVVLTAHVGAVHVVDDA